MKKVFEPYSSFEGRFVVLEFQSKAHEDSYLYRGIVLRREGEMDETKVKRLGDVEHKIRTPVLSLCSS